MVAEIVSGLVLIIGYYLWYRLSKSLVNKDELYILVAIYSVPFPLFVAAFVFYLLFIKW